MPDIRMKSEKCHLCTVLSASLFWRDWMSSIEMGDPDPQPLSFWLHKKHQLCLIRNGTSL